MIRRYHGNTKIFFPKPYVMRISYSHDMPQSMIDTKHRELIRKTYKLFKVTWGHSPLLSETIQVQESNTPVVISTPATMLSSLFGSSYSTEIRSYFCFKDEIDALQFRLTIDTAAMHVHIWPSEATFIIHEVVEDES